MESIRYMQELFSEILYSSCQNLSNNISDQYIRKTYPIRSPNFVFDSFNINKDFPHSNICDIPATYFEFRNYNGAKDTYQICSSNTTKLSIGNGIDIHSIVHFQYWSDFYDLKMKV